MARRARTSAATEPPKATQGARTRAPLTPSDVLALTNLLRERGGWEPREHQIAGVQAQIEGVNMILQAATGSGKTAIAAGPHFWPGFEKKITFMVCPLLTLEEEMVATFANEFDLPALALNSVNGACSRETIDDVLRGKYKIIILSPEMAQSRVFVDRVLRNAKFMRRVLALFIDEAHCISHWGANFRKKYGTLGNVIAFLPRGTPVIAVTATLTPRVRRDLHRVLGFQKGLTRLVNIGNDRPNIALVVRSCHHPMNTYADLNFFLPHVPRVPADVPKTYVYVDSVAATHEIADLLGDILHERAQASGLPLGEHRSWRELVRPFNASMSPAYRAAAMDAFRRGEIRVLVCTEAAGMGCNISDVDIVIQWKLPTTTSNFLQRAGRAARDSRRQGLAVLLVEKSAYSTALTVPGARGARKRARAPNPSQSQEPPSQSNSQPAPALPATTRKRGKEYAIAHGMERGSQSARDEVPTGEQPDLNVEAPDEGLSTFVLSVTCRRSVLAQIYDNPTQVTAPAPCCDICHPELLQRTRASPPTISAKAKPLARGEPDPTARRALWAWREMVYARDHAIFEYDETAVLSDTLIEDLISVGPLTEATVRRVLFAHWPFWDKHAEELIPAVLALDIRFTPLATAKPRTRATAPMAPPSQAGTPPPLDCLASAPPTPDPISRPASTVSQYASPRTRHARWDRLGFPTEPKPALDRPGPAHTMLYTPALAHTLKRPASRANIDYHADARLAKHAHYTPALHSLPRYPRDPLPNPPPSPHLGAQPDYARAQSSCAPWAAGAIIPPHLTRPPSRRECHSNATRTQAHTGITPSHAIIKPRAHAAHGAVPAAYSQPPPDYPPPIIQPPHSPCLWSPSFTFAAPPHVPLSPAPISSSQPVFGTPSWDGDAGLAELSRARRTIAASAQTGVPTPPQAHHIRADIARLHPGSHMQQGLPVGRATRAPHLYGAQLPF